MASEEPAPKIEAEETKTHPAPEGTHVLVTGPGGLTMETTVDEDGVTGEIPAAFSPATIQVLLEDRDAR